MATTLNDGRVVHDKVIGVCPKSECGGDLVPVMTDEQLDAYLRGRARRRAAVASRGVGALFDPDAFFGQELRVYPKEDL